METALIIVGIVITGLVVYMLIARKRDLKPSVPPNRVPSMPYQRSTPEGADVISYKPIDNESWPAVAASIDGGISSCIAGMLPDWTLGRHHTDYLIAFVEPTAQTAMGEPALAIAGIKSAGTVVGVGGDGYHTPTILLPFQDGWRFPDYLTNSVWFEGEHYAEWLNDEAVFWRYTGINDSHPHRELPKAVGFAAVSENRMTRTHPGCGLSAFKKA